MLMLRLFRLPYLVLLVLAAVFVSGAVSCVAAAATSRGFGSDGTLVAGAMVSLDAARPGSVIAATSENSAKLVGVVVPVNSATLQFNTPDAQTQVAESGTAAVMVSDLNGAIKAGDRIAASPVAGVGMKALEAGVIIGIAQTDLSAAGSLRRNITSKTGKVREINVSQIKVLVGVGQYTPPHLASYIPSTFQTLADAVSGRQTAPWRVLASLVIILVSLVVMGAIVYASIRNSLIAIGRNPLSSPVIYRSLFQLVTMTVGLLFIALFATYLVLTQ